MAYYKIIEGGYILGIGTGHSDEQITEAEYEEIMAAMRSKPTDGKNYRLRVDLTWEIDGNEVLPDEPTDEEYAIAGRILLGGII